MWRGQVGVRSLGSLSGWESESKHRNGPVFRSEKQSRHHTDGNAYRTGDTSAIFQVEIENVDEEKSGVDVEVAPRSRDQHGPRYLPIRHIHGLRDPPEVLRVFGPMVGTATNDRSIAKPLANRALDDR